MALRKWSNLIELQLVEMIGGPHLENIHNLCPHLRVLSASIADGPVEMREDKGDSVQGEEALSRSALLGKGLGTMEGLRSVILGGIEFGAEAILDVLGCCLTISKMRFYTKTCVTKLELPQLPLPSVRSSQLREMTLTGSGLISVTCPRNSSWDQLESLTLSGCESLVIVNLDCPNLRNLDLR